MQAVQVVLFIVVVALALPLMAYVVLPRLRAGRQGGRPAPDAPPAEAAPRSPPPPPMGLICPSCRREYPTGLKYCPVDARALVAAVGSAPASRTPAGTLTCPVCKRSYEGNKRFCPYDAEELMPLPLAVARKPRLSSPGLPHVLGKICPHCAKRYDSEATFCGHDGSELVSVN